MQRSTTNSSICRSPFLGRFAPSNAYPHHQTVPSLPHCKGRNQLKVKGRFVVKGRYKKLSSTTCFPLNRRSHKPFFVIRQLQIWLSILPLDVLCHFPSWPEYALMHITYPRRTYDAASTRYCAASFSQSTGNLSSPYWKTTSALAAVSPG